MKWKKLAKNGEKGHNCYPLSPLSPLVDVKMLHAIDVLLNQIGDKRDGDRARRFGG